MKIIGHGVRIQCIDEKIPIEDVLKSECCINCLHCYKNQCILINNKKVYLNNKELFRLTNIFRSNALNILPYVLKQNDCELIIHGSSCTFQGNTICIVGASGTGKSSIIYYLIKDYNADYLSDDITRIGVNGILPCYIQPMLIREKKDSFVLPIKKHLIVDHSNNAINLIIFLTNSDKNQLLPLSYAQILLFLSMHSWNFYDINRLAQFKILKNSAGYFISGNIQYKKDSVISILNKEIK